MTPRQQRIEIAKHMKWKNIREFAGALIGIRPNTENDQSLPDYLFDLDAMRSAVVTITDKDLQSCFIGELEQIVSRDPNANLWYWALTTSTAEQQAEAFLRTINRWIYTVDKNQINVSPNPYLECSTSLNLRSRSR